MPMTIEDIQDELTLIRNQPVDSLSAFDYARYQQLSETLEQIGTDHV